MVDMFKDEWRRRIAWDGLYALVAEAHDNAVQHGFYDDYYEVINFLREHDRKDLMAIVRQDFILAQMCKIVGEIGEGVSAIQNRRSDELPEELSDVLIRLADLAGFMQLDFPHDVLTKMEKNRGRPYKHGKVC